MNSVNVNIDMNFICYECGDELDFQDENNNEVKLSPCDSCLKKAEAEGDKVGNEEGYNDGFAEGNEEGFEKGVEEGHNKGYMEGHSHGIEEGKNSCKCSGTI